MDTIKLGILGLGRIGKIHLETICTKIEGVNVIAAMNPSIEGRSFADRYGIQLVTDNALAVIHHPEIDAVLICSPTNTHSDYVIQAAHAGKAIFCEKPLDLSLNKVRETLQIVSNANVPLMIAFNQRLDPNFETVKKEIVAGKLGRLFSVRITSRDPGPPPISYIKQSGGLFMDMTIHDFDMARYIVGAEVVEVFAKGYNLVDPEIGKAGDIDTGIILLTFDNEVTVIIENCRKASYGYDQRLEVFGSLGMMKVENPIKNDCRFFDEKGTHLPRHLDFFMDRYAMSYQKEMEAFIHALKNKQPMPISGDDGLKAMIIAQAANISVKESRPVRIEEIK